MTQIVMPEWLKGDVLDVRKVVTFYLALQDAGPTTVRSQKVAYNKVCRFPCYAETVIQSLNTFLTNDEIFTFPSPITRSLAPSCTCEFDRLPKERTRSQTSLPEHFSATPSPRSICLRRSPAQWYRREYTSPSLLGTITLLVAPSVTVSFLLFRPIALTRECDY